MISILVDTSVWSEALRRKSKPGDEGPGGSFLKSIIDNDDVIVLPGIVLQELLTGIKSEKLFNEIRDILDGFSWLEPGKDDYVQAALLKNRLKTKGIAATAIDCLIATLSMHHHLLLATYDADFTHIARHSELKLLDFKTYKKMKES
jgi:predicted nucleic acid-binding protein